MKLSLLDLLDLFGGSEAEGAADLETPSEIELTRDIERGWPIHPADAQALAGAFNALGLLAPPARAGDDGLFDAIARFQESEGLRPDSSMRRGGTTILHLNKALRTRRAPPPPSVTDPASAAAPPQQFADSFRFADLVRARRTRDAQRAVASGRDLARGIASGGPAAGSIVLASQAAALAPPAAAPPAASPTAPPAGRVVGPLLRGLGRAAWPFAVADLLLPPTTEEQSVKQPAAEPVRLPDSDEAAVADSPDGAAERSIPRPRWESARQAQRRRARADQ